VIRGRWCALVFGAIATASTMTIEAQIGGKPVSGGNPTPGTEQPSPPNASDRITLSGCLRAASKSTKPTPDPNEPSDSRFTLVNAERVDRLPLGTGGSPLAAASKARVYRLAGIDSQFSPFVGTRVEISGEIKSPSSGARADESPTLLVEFVRKTDSACR
jgi:hypothetical protein